ncbi:MAG: hypothetical protein K2X11_08110 [Acetobacteraceae bacterium]|nr:hypothetical protein [Acetobacteraceae bacterium]
MRRLLAVLLLALASPAEAQVQARDLTVRNDTATVVREIYLTGRNMRERGPDRLGQEVLRPGAEFRIRLNQAPACELELRAIYEDRSEERRPVNVCEGQAVRLSDDNLRTIEIANDSDAELLNLYLVPSGSSERGPDRLGAATVPALDSFQLRLRNLEGCRFEARAVFRGAPNRPETRPLDVCQGSPRLAFGDASVPLREAQVANRTRTTLRELYIRNPGAAGWGADRLGSAVLEGGQSWLLRTRRADCRVDLRAVFQNNREVLREGVDLCAGQPIAFLPGRTLVLRHEHGRPVREAYLSPAEDSDWGPDVLAGRPLARGETREVGMDGGCQADLRVVFDNGNAEEMRGFNLCERNDITLRPGWVTE